MIRHDLLAGDDRPETAVGERCARILLERSHEHGRPRGLPQVVVARPSEELEIGVELVGALEGTIPVADHAEALRIRLDVETRVGGRVPPCDLERPVGRAVVERDHRDALVLEREHGLDHRSDELLAPVHRKPDHDACGLGLV